MYIIYFYMYTYVKYVKYIKIFNIFEKILHKRPMISHLLVTGTYITEATLDAHASEVRFV